MKLEDAKRRGTWIVTVLTALAMMATVACGDPVRVIHQGAPGGSESPSPDAVEPPTAGEIFEFGAEDLQLSDVIEVASSSPFRYFEIFLVGDASMLEYQLEGGNSQGQWQRFVPRGTFNGQAASTVTLGSEATALRFRGTEGVTYLLIEIFENPVEYPNHGADHAHDDGTELADDPDYGELADDSALRERTSGLTFRSQELITSCSRRRMAAYSNGRRVADIDVIQMDGKNVGVNSGSAYERMRIAASRTGVRMTVVSGFRTQSEQQYLYNCYLTRRCNNGNLAAPPGYSNHQNGIAFDLNTETPGVYRWLSANAHSFGFRRTVPSEPWHWEYVSGRTVTPQVCGGSSPVNPPPSGPTPNPEPTDQPCTSRSVADAPGPFGDLRGDHWARSAAETLYEQGVTSGCQTSPRLFCPDCPVTREQAAGFLSRARRLVPVSAATPTFQDVPATHPNFGHIEALRRRGMVTGCSTSPSMFCPDQPLTRGQAAMMIAGAMDLPNGPVTTPSFADVQSSSAWAASIERLLGECLVTGCARNPPRFCPDRTISRAEFSVLLVKALGLGDATACQEGSQCANGVCVSDAPLRFTLIWSDQIDLDIHVLTPNGEKLWYRNRVIGDGGQFDSDTCIGTVCPSGGPLRESVFWGRAPTPGTYTFWAVNYTGGRGASLSFEVAVGGTRRDFSATVPDQTNSESFRFQISVPDGAVVTTND